MLKYQQNPSTSTQKNKEAQIKKQRLKQNGTHPWKRLSLI